jgi:hypothetical protein
MLTTCLGAIIVFFGNCKKDLSTNSTFMVGTWELRQAQNRMIPTIEYSSGNGNIFKFSDSAYEKYTNENLIKSGHYILIRDASVGAEVGLAIPPNSSIE